jgi:hypothetical protein
VGECMIETILTSILTSSVIVGIVGAIVKRGISHHFNQKIEEFKHNSQKQIQDFSLYNTKKHEIIPKLSSLILESFSYVSSLTGLRELPDYTEYSKSDLERSLTDKKLLQSKIDEFAQLHQEDPVKANKEIWEYMKIIESQVAKNKYIEANNYFRLNELYLKTEIANKITIVMAKIYTLNLDTQYLLRYQHKPNIPLEKSESELEFLISELRDSMRDDLSKSV